ncbi:hypothetical protein FOZ61_007784 [Perkinsus olseni]|uniref:Uncharacterized protein n=1 Tax=Perkinsus olseni TaxID=32597 RepID=A0A7J6L7B9_PEROL|nr:hypothetical protein FOZ61_007784 [Perkinsus olseni]KAF4658190.1 hypothetical protein FOL46_007065 [Perkinsus olseni]
MSCPPRVRRSETNPPQESGAGEATERAYYFFPGGGLSIRNVTDLGLERVFFHESLAKNKESQGPAADRLCQRITESVQNMTSARSLAQDWKNHEKSPPFFELHNQYPMGPNTSAHYTFLSRAVPETLVDFQEEAVNITNMKFLQGTAGEKKTYRVKSEPSPEGVVYSLQFAVEDTKLILEKMVCPKRSSEGGDNQGELARGKKKKKSSKKKVKESPASYSFKQGIESFPSSWLEFLSISHLKKFTVSLPDGSNFEDVKAAALWLLVGAIHETTHKLQTSEHLLQDEDITYLTTFYSPGDILVRRFCYEFATPEAEDKQEADAEPPKLSRLGTLRKSISKHLRHQD